MAGLEVPGAASDPTARSGWKRRGALGGPGPTAEGAGPPPEGAAQVGAAGQVGLGPDHGSWGSGVAPRQPWAAPGGPWWGQDKGQREGRIA